MYVFDAGGVLPGVGRSGLDETGEIELKLRHQLGDLETIAGRITDALSGLPSSRGGGIWRGPAHGVYLTALGLLTADIRAAESNVDEALLQTRRALSTIDGYGR